MGKDKKKETPIQKERKARRATKRAREMEKAKKTFYLRGRAGRRNKKYGRVRSY